MSVEALPVDPAAAASAAAAPDSAAVTREHLAFTGEGGEYFRIWVVNTLLSIVTLGIYSAWAKVRKASYFARNTRLLGDGFEYTAAPLAILRGRVIAVALFAFYSFAFDFSLTLGLAATAVVIGLAPLLFASSLSFKLRNTRWRALPFEFTATRGDAYRTILIVVALWLSTSVAAALSGELSLIVVGAVALVSGVMFPWMHHRLKAFQHRHVAFGGLRSRFRSAVASFYGIYLVGGVLLVGGSVLGSLVAGAIVGATKTAASGIPWIVGTLVAAFGYVAAWPYFAVRIQQAVWTRTTIGPYEFATSIRFRTLLPIALKNAALLAVTAGLYWPFATIAWARYRIGCMEIVLPSSAEHAVASLSAAATTSAAGEGALDFFGIDIGW